MKYIIIFILLMMILSGCKLIQKTENCTLEGSCEKLNYRNTSFIEENLSKEEVRYECSMGELIIKQYIDENNNTYFTPWCKITMVEAEEVCECDFETFNKSGRCC